MACYTVVEVKLDDDEYTRKAMERLGIKTDRVSEEVARRVKKEAGIIKTQTILRRLNPTAVIRRTGDKLFVQAQV